MTSDLALQTIMERKHDADDTGMRFGSGLTLNIDSRSVFDFEVGCTRFSLSRFEVSLDFEGAKTKDAERTVRGVYLRVIT